MVTRAYKGGVIMNAIERRVKELRAYGPAQTGREDLGVFWDEVLKESRSKPLEASRVEVGTVYQGMNVYKVNYKGFDDTTIHGQFLVPNLGKEGPYACVVIYPGYTNGKGEPEDYAPWLLMGMAVFAVDVRGQGGETGNKLGGSYGMSKGWITEGILDKANSYYMAITIDAYKAIDWVARQDEIDSTRIAVVGASQGGGLALITAALHDQVSLVVADIPNMCHMDYGMLHGVGSLSEVAEFCRRHPEHLEQVLENLSYFDMLNLADRLEAPIMMSVGLKDTVCMPEQIFPVYDLIGSSQKRLEIYPFTAHAVEAAQRKKGMQFVYDGFMNE